MFSNGSYLDRYHWVFNFKNFYSKCSGNKCTIIIEGSIEGIDGKNADFIRKF